MSVYVYASLCDFVCIALLLPFVLGFCLSIFIFFFSSFFFFFSLVLAALGVRCCMQAFSSCGQQGLLLVVVHGLLIAVASLVAEHRL